MADNTRELLFFEWVVVDNCNLLCDYCVNRGKFSHKAKDSMAYVPGIELRIAERIVELSDEAKKVVVNLTGGEPTISHYFKEMVNLLVSKKNIDVQLITNFSNYRKILPIADKFSSVLISIHASHRSLAQIEAYAEAINAIKHRTKITLSQVDSPLSDEDRSKLALLTRKTGLKICFQPYIPPRSHDIPEKEHQTKTSESFVTSKGKRCSLGHTYFFINSDGSFFHGQWCNDATRKIGNFLSPLPDIKPLFHSGEMDICPFTYCGCNYNTFNYREYRAECKKLGYPKSQTFGRTDIKFSRRLKGLLATLKNRYLGK